MIMWLHTTLNDKELFSLVHAGKIRYGGYLPGKIFGLLSCRSGKRMKRCNRVFFESMQAAVDAGFRPCAHCMTHEYRLWKKSNVDL